MNRLAVVLLPLGVAVAGCGPIDLPGCGAGPIPESNIDVTVSTVTLGDQCATSSALVAGDCASNSPNCGICRSSSVQLDLASREHRDVPFTVVEVYLLDSNGARIATLTASGPTQWDGKTYAAWDEQLASRTNLKAKYTLTAPDWSHINGSARLAAPQQFKTQVLVNIGGQLRTIDGPEAFREPEVAT